MVAAGGSRRQLERTLAAALRDGLISEQTFAARLDEVLDARLIEPHRVVGDLLLRSPERRLRNRLSTTMQTVVGMFAGLLGDGDGPPAVLLALDWVSPDTELVIGRSLSCDIVLLDTTVSRRHARLIFRRGRWVLQDLASTNGSVLNGRRVGRCELRPGDELYLGHARLRVD